MWPRMLDDVVEAAGWVAGWALAPLVAVGTAVRGTRLFHAEGQTHRAVASAAADDERLLPLSRRLSGPALVRTSAALWSGREWPDLLGLSVRFFGRGGPGRRVATDRGLQDLLMVSASSLLGLPLSFALTDVHDVLANEYHGLVPFRVAGLGDGWIRAVWLNTSPAGATRGERLARAVEQKVASFRVEVRPDAEDRWLPLVAVALQERVTIGPELHFQPFRDDAGLRPTGFVEALRVGTYITGQASRGARPATEAKTVAPADSPRADRVERRRRSSSNGDSAEAIEDGDVDSLDHYEARPGRQ